MSTQQPNKMDKVVNRTLFKGATYTAKGFERHIGVTAKTANPTWVLTLPPPGSAVDQWLCIFAEEIADGQTVTVKAPSVESNVWDGDQVLDATYELVIFWSDGRFWHLMKETVT